MEEATWSSNRLPELPHNSTISFENYNSARELCLGKETASDDQTQDNSVISVTSTHNKYENKIRKLVESKNENVKRQTFGNKFPQEMSLQEKRHTAPRLLINMKQADLSKTKAPDVRSLSVSRGERKILSPITPEQRKKSKDKEKAMTVSPKAVSKPLTDIHYSEHSINIADVTEASLSIEQNIKPDIQTPIPEQNTILVEDEYKKKVDIPSRADEKTPVEIVDLNSEEFKPQNEEIEAYIKHHTKELQYLFNKYSSWEEEKKKGGLLLRSSLERHIITQSGILQMIRDCTLHSLITRKKVEKLVQLVNTQLLNKSQNASLDFEGFIKFIVQLAIYIFARRTLKQSDFQFLPCIKKLMYILCLVIHAKQSWKQLLGTNSIDADSRVGTMESFESFSQEKVTDDYKSLPQPSHVNSGTATNKSFTAYKEQRKSSEVRTSNAYKISKEILEEIINKHFGARQVKQKSLLDAPQKESSLLSLKEKSIRENNYHSHQGPVNTIESSVESEPSRRKLADYIGLKAKMRAIHNFKEEGKLMAERGLKKEEDKFEGKKLSKDSELRDKINEMVKAKQEKAMNKVKEAAQKNEQEKKIQEDDVSNKKERNEQTNEKEIAKSNLVAEKLAKKELKQQDQPNEKEEIKPEKSSTLNQKSIEKKEESQVHPKEEEKNKSEKFSIIIKRPTKKELSEKNQPKDEEEKKLEESSTFSDNTAKKKAEEKAKGKEEKKFEKTSTSNQKPVVIVEQKDRHKEEENRTAKRPSIPVVIENSSKNTIEPKSQLEEEDKRTSEMFIVLTGNSPEREQLQKSPTKLSFKHLSQSFKDLFYKRHKLFYILFNYFKKDSKRKVLYYKEFLDFNIYFKIIPYLVSEVHIKNLFDSLMRASELELGLSYTNFLQSILEIIYRCYSTLNKFAITPIQAEEKRFENIDWINLSYGEYEEADISSLSPNKEDTIQHEVSFLNNSTIDNRMEKGEETLFITSKTLEGFLIYLNLPNDENELKWRLKKFGTSTQKVVALKDLRRSKHLLLIH